MSSLLKTLRRNTRRQRRRWIRAAKAVADQPLYITASQPLKLDASAEAAGDDAPKRFHIVAYTGGAMRLPGYRLPVVVDIAGMQVNSETRPILKDHDPQKVVGHTNSVAIGGNVVTVDGLLSGVGEAADEVRATAANGFPWQASIGAEPDEPLELIDRGKTVQANGQTFMGPIYIARKTTLREVSFTALGADDHTTATVAASHDGSSAMFEEWLRAMGFDPAALTDQQTASLRRGYELDHGGEVNANANAGEGGEREEETVEAGAGGSSIQTGQQTTDTLLATFRQESAAEVTRIRAISGLCAQHDAPTIEVDGQQRDLESHAIQAGLTSEQVELHLLRAARPSGPAIHVANRDAPTPDVLQAAVCRSGGLGSDMIEASFTAQTLERVDRDYRRGVGLQELLIQCAHANGYHGTPFIRGDGTLQEVLRAAFTTSEVSTILSDSANKFLLEAFNFVEQTWSEIAATRPVDDFKNTTSYRLTADAQFEKVGKDGQLKHGKIGEDSFTNRAETYGKIYGITREHIINDDLGAFTSLNQVIGRGAGLKLNDVFWAEFVDNASFFTAGRNNYFEGATTALDLASLATAEQMFLDQTDHHGKPLGAMPKLLLVPTALKVTAQEIYESTHLNTGGSSTKNKQPNANVYAGSFPPVVSTYLGNASYGNSNTGWYLLADPRDLAVIEVCFLNGVRQPTVENAAADFDQLGIMIRGFFDFGVAKQEHRGGVKSKGKA